MISPLYFHTDILSDEIKSPTKWNTFQRALKSYQFLVTCDAVENDTRLCHSYKNICANRDRQLPFLYIFFIFCVFFAVRPRSWYALFRCDIIPDHPSKGDRTRSTLWFLWHKWSNSGRHQLHLTNVKKTAKTGSTIFKIYFVEDAGLSSKYQSLYQWCIYMSLFPPAGMSIQNNTNI